MSRGASMTVENSFNKGLLTGFTAMNFPENAVTDADNVIFGELGDVTRRPGIDFEDDHSVIELSDITSLPNAYTEYRWSSVSNDGTKTFLVQQIGNKIVFFESSGSGSISKNKKSFEVNLIDFRSKSSVTSTEISNQICRYTDGLGYLVVVHPLCEPFSVSYNADDDDITTTEIIIEVRDLQGVDDGLDVDERPSTLSDLHKYNLYNQGWYIGVQDVWDVTRNVITSWSAYWDEQDPDHIYPGNSDIWWLFKNASEKFDPRQKDNFTLGNTPAPKGHYIFNAFNIDRSGASGVPGIESTTAGTARPSCVQFFAGRFWFAGVNTDKFSANVYFSQSIERDDQIGKCYQVNDPTSETVFDLLDTDGGMIPLPRIERVIDMKVIGSSLLVIGSNAVFTIRGDDNGAFRATNYTVDYVSSIGATSPLSIVDIDGTIMWINYDALYALQPDNIGINFQVQNVSKQTIQSIIDSIPQSNKNYIKGYYNKRLQIVRWIFSDADSLTGYKYNRFLDFNIASRAFYTHTIDISLAPYVSGIISIFGQGVDSIEEDVTVNSVTVTDSVGNDVFITTTRFTPNEEVFKFVVTGLISSGSSGLTYGDLSNLDYLDWESFNSTGKPFTSYGVSGYRIRGELLRTFQTTPVIFVVRNVTNGKLTVQGVWDYGSRISLPQEVYRNVDSTMTNLIKKIKIRGKGRSMQIKFSSVDNHPFELVGWSTFDTGGTAP